MDIEEVSEIPNQFRDTKWPEIIQKFLDRKIRYARITDIKVSQASSVRLCIKRHNYLVNCYVRNGSVFLLNPNVDP